MALASYTDANAWLDEDKLTFEGEVDAKPESLNADRYVSAALGENFPGLFDVWVWDSESDPTPPIIRDIASMLMAAYRYAKKYSGEALDENDYSARLLRMANDIIAGIKGGTITVPEVPGGSTSLDFGSLNFWPNKNTVVTKRAPGFKTGDPLRMFSVEQPL